MPASIPNELAIKRCGTAKLEPESVELIAGKLSAELFCGALRNIRFAGVELLRGISYQARDRFWSTYAPVISALEVQQQEDGFKVSYSARHADTKQAVQTLVQIEGRSDGTLRFVVKAQPETEFVTNRTGLVILHLLQGVAGESVEVQHVNGDSSVHRITERISPGQPIFDIRSVSHQPVPGLKATVLMEGAGFEMEDHRNWMDASFKTYSGSLRDPWPYSLIQDVSYTQSARLTVSCDNKVADLQLADVSIKEPGIRVSVGKPGGYMPKFGSAVALNQPENTLTQLDALSNSTPDYLIARLDGRDTNLVTTAETCSALRSTTDIPLTAELILPAQADAHTETETIAATLRAVSLKPDAVIVTQAHDMMSFQPGESRPDGPSYQQMADAARAVFPNCPIGGGVIAFFTELNRQPVPEGLFDFVTHSVCPVVHAADDQNVMQNLEAISWIAASVRSMIGTTPYHLGPSWISSRCNPYGDGVVPNPENERLCVPESDPRQRGLFGAAWMLGLVSTCAASGMDAMALASLTGPQGIICSDHTTLPSLFQTAEARVFPAFHVFAGISALSERKRLQIENGSPSKISSLAVETENGPELWLANLSAETQHVHTAGLTSKSHLLTIDESSFEKTLQPDFLSHAGVAFNQALPVKLLPFAIARISPAAV